MREPRNDDTLRYGDCYLADLPVLASFIARHALMVGGDFYLTELRDLVIVEAMRQCGSRKLAAERLGISKNGLDLAIKRAREARRVGGKK